jgi:hypothetical protein
MRRIISILLTFSSLCVFGEVRAQNTTGPWPNSIPPGGLRGVPGYGENYRQGYREGYRDGYREHRHREGDSRPPHGENRYREGYRNPASVYPQPYTPSDRVNYYGVPRR